LNHWNLFKESWRIFWRNPALWFFGLLAVLGGGYNLRYNFNFNFNPDLRSLSTAPVEFRALINQIFSNQAFGVIVAIGIVWTIFAFLLATFTDGALMSMVNSISSGQKISVGTGFHAGSKRFLPLLAVRFMLALPALILSLIAAVSIGQMVITNLPETVPFGAFARSFSDVAGWGMLSFVVALLMTAIGVSAERAVVLDELSIWPAMVKGWKTLWSKFGDYFTIMLLFIMAGIIVGLILACILTPILCGTIIGFTAYTAAGMRNNNAIMSIAGPSLIITVLVGLLFGALVNVFSSSVWTLAFREWQSQERGELTVVTE
jgi:hypothetical protein